MSRSWSRRTTRRPNRGCADLRSSGIAIDIDRSGLNPLADLRLLARISRIAEAASAGRVPRLHDQAQHLRLASPRARSAFRRSPMSAGSGTAFIRARPLQRDGHRAVPVRACAGRAVVFFQNPDDRALFVEPADRPAGAGAAASRLGRRSRPVRAGAAAVGPADLPADRPAAPRQGRARVRRGRAIAAAPNFPMRGSSCLARSTRATARRSRRAELDAWVARRRGRISRRRPTTCARSSRRRRGGAAVLPRRLAAIAARSRGDGPAADRHRRSGLPRRGRGRRQRLSLCQSAMPASLADGHANAC